MGLCLLWKLTTGLYFKIKKSEDLHREGDMNETFSSRVIFLTEVPPDIPKHLLLALKSFESQFWMDFLDDSEFIQHRLTVHLSSRWCTDKLEPTQNLWAPHGIRAGLSWGFQFKRDLSVFHQVLQKQQASLDQALVEESSDRRFNESLLPVSVCLSLCVSLLCYLNFSLHVSVSQFLYLSICVPLSLFLFSLFSSFLLFSLLFPFPCLCLLYSPSF